MTETGVWDDIDAEGHIFDYTLGRWLGKNLNKEKQLFDLGCGLGTYLGYFQDIGFKKLIGVDGYIFQKREFNNIIEHDLATPLDLKRKGNVLCLEVGEHLREEDLPTFIDNIIRHLSGELIISWALPEQAGTGHISCRSNDWVIEQLTNRGLKFDERKTLEARKHTSPHCAYFRETLMCFYNEII